jgi:hypothetical protein
MGFKQILEDHSHIEPVSTHQMIDSVQLYKGTQMKFILKTIALLAVTATVAYASCPPYAPYNCRPGPNGKQICGCGV